MKKNWMFLIVSVVSLFILVRFIFGFLERDDKPEIVVVLKTSNAQYWNIIESGAKKAFHDFNIDGRIVVPESESKINEQVAMLKNILEQKPDALIVAPIQPYAAVPVLKEYKKSNIPVLLVDTEANWNGQTSFIGTDNYNLGEKSGELLASMLQPGDQVALIHPTIVNPDVSARLNGARDVLEGAGVNIVSVRPADNESGEVKMAMESVLQTVPNIKGVFATTDTIAISAIKEFKEKGIRIPVVGTDGTMEIVREIEEGTLSATIAQNPYDMGYISVEAASKVARGEEIEKNIDTGVDIITKDNAKLKLAFLEKLLW